MTLEQEFIADDPRMVAAIRDAAGDGRPERIDTHGAAVFLAGSFAYKIKRPVAFPYMDLSTQEKRRAACEAEIRLNRRTAPDIYLGIAPLRRDADSLTIGAVGDPIAFGDECVVVMRRFDQHTLFDRMAARGRLGADLVLGLAEAIATFHNRAEVIRDRGGPKEMGWVVEENIEELSRRTDVFAIDDLNRLATLTRAAVERLAATMKARMAAGFVRHCHGDLHLRNVCLFEGAPTIFDALEFNDTLAVTDTMYDLAYVLMDLLHRGLPGPACALLNRYLERFSDDGGLVLLSFFMSVRAAVRAKVSLSMADVQSDPSAAETLRGEAQDYLARAIGFLERKAPAVVAVGGLSGSGKSTVARALAPHLAPAPGAIVLRSDVIRKTLMGVEETERLGPAGYAPEVSQRVYDTLVGRAQTIAAAGFSVVADATFTKSDGRTAIADAAATVGCSFAGYWLDADPDTLVARVAARVNDPSDADAAVVRRQLADDVGVLDWVRLDGRRPASAIAGEIAALVGKMS